MNLQFSLYLDLIRFFAAVLVLIWHANVRYLSTELLPLSQHGHIAVMFFFVLSGYVIAYVTDVKENRFSLYWASRLSRIYSVAIPVVLLTPLLDIWGNSVAEIPVIYAITPFDHWPIRVLASLFFVNELWFTSIQSFSNTPFWSLCYEMSYYLVFALAVFIKGRLRWWAVGFSCLIIGPKILLLFPVWLMGVYLYHSKALEKLSNKLAWGLFIASWVFLIAWEMLGVSLMIRDYLKILVGADFVHLLNFSKYFIGDWVIGVVIMLNFAAFRTIGPQFAKLLDPMRKVIRYLASFTLTLYLFHQPLLKFYAALIGGEEGNIMYFWQTMAVTLVTIFVLGHLTEHRREGMRQWLRRRLTALETRPFMQRLLQQPQ